MAKFAQYYLKYNLENIFSAEYKDKRQQIFGAFFETNESIGFVLGKDEDKKVYKHQVYHLSQNKDIIVKPLPHQVIIDLGNIRTVKGFRILTRDVNHPAASRISASMAARSSSCMSEWLLMKRTD